MKEKQNKAATVEDTIVIRCFLNNKRKWTDQLTREEAENFRVAALHLVAYLTNEYGLGNDTKIQEAKSLVHTLREAKSLVHTLRSGANPSVLSKLYKLIEYL